MSITIIYHPYRKLVIPWGIYSFFLGGGVFFFFFYELVENLSVIHRKSFLLQDSSLKYSHDAQRDLLFNIQFRKMNSKRSYFFLSSRALHGNNCRKLWPFQFLVGTALF